MAYIKEFHDNNKEIMFEAGIEEGENNQKYKQTREFQSKKNAERWLNNMLNSNNKDLHNNNITVGEQLDNWLESQETSLRKPIYNRLEVIINQHLKPTFGHLPLNELDSVVIQQYFVKKRNDSQHNRNNFNLTEENIKRVYSVLKNMLKNAVELNLISTNPLKNFDFQPSKNTNNNIMTKEEVERLLTAAKEDEFMYRFIYTLLMSGMRRNEISALEWDEVNFQEDYIEVKQILNSRDLEIKEIRSPRKIYMHHKLAKELKKHKLSQFDTRLKQGLEYNYKQNFVFCNSQGYPYYPVSYKKRFKSVLKKASLDESYSIHTLRQTHYSLKENIVPLESIRYFTPAHTLDDTISLYQKSQLED